jgi:hypothetical protein
MKNTWINHPVILQGTNINLVPLEEKHLEELYTAAADKELWHLFRQIAQKEIFFIKLMNLLSVKELPVTNILLS